MGRVAECVPARAAKLMSSLPRTDGPSARPRIFFADDMRDRVLAVGSPFPTDRRLSIKPYTSLLLAVRRNVVTQRRVDTPFVVAALSRSRHGSL